MWRNLQKKKIAPIELKKIDHSKISYIPLKKNFYIESPEITNLSNNELNQIIQENKIKTHGINIPRPILNFYQCGFNSIILSILKLKNFTEPLPIQKISFPVLMSGRDCIGISETGSGKTLAYILPMFRHIINQPKLNEGEGPISIILVPTRELAIQIYKEISYFSEYLKINCACCYGGSAIGNQINQIRRGVEIIVGTPGRLIELLSLNNGKLMNLYRCSFVVLDEADRMFDLGFEGQISNILTNIRPDKQIVMFSATFPKSIENIAKKILNNNYIEIVIGNRSSVNENITQEIILVEKKNSLHKLCEILDKNENLSIMIFTDNKSECINLWENLFKKGYECVCIEGNIDQEDRYNSLKLFENKEKKILITTSILSRGLDIPNVELIINFSCPNYMEDYIHRIGRTGRGKNKGKAITFIDKNIDENKVGDIIQALKNSNENVPFELEEIHREYLKKMESGNCGKFKINGYLGRGYKFDEIEKEKNNIERYLLGSGENYINNNIENNIENNIVDMNKLINKYNDIKNKETEKKNMSLTLRNQNQEYKNKQKLNFIKRDPKLKQICLEVGMNAAKAALISGKKEEEILKMVSIAINNTLNSYKNNSYSKGVENVNKIIEEYEMNENIKNHIFSIEFNINDYPFNTRLKYTNNTFLNKIKENDNVEVVLKGVFLPPGKTLPVGEKKLCLVIRGKNVNDVNNAFKEIKKNFDEDALDYYTSLTNFTKY
jgi:ATP-dependent RNA helicase DDX46/PRP5